jgi:hypothetical protein
VAASPQKVQMYDGMGDDPPALTELP